MVSEPAPVQPPAVDNAVPADIPKRDAANGNSGVEEPPSKKARLDDKEVREDTRDLRDRGIAPIKKE
jgi:hypothetical protein